MTEENPATALNELYEKRSFVLPTFQNTVQIVKNELFF